jgi:hypothetical protein
VHCPVHRLCERISPFCCALSGGSPDSYCVLSGAPMKCFLKNLSLALARGQGISFSTALCPGALSSPLPHRRRGPAACSGDILQLSGSTSLVSCYLPPLCLSFCPVSSPPFHLLAQFKFLCKSMNPRTCLCLDVFIVFSYRFLAPL